MNIAMLLQMASESCPERIALTHDGKNYSYKQLYEEAQVAASMIRNENCSSVAILDTSSPAIPIAMMAAAIIGIPLMATIGYLHYKKAPAYSSEVDVGIERNPYVFKLQPGWNQKVVFPMYRVLTIMLVKLSNNEKLTDDEMAEIKKILDDIEHLSKGGWINKPKGMV